MSKLFLLFVFVLAWIQSANAFDVKGVSFGISVEELRQHFGSELKCNNWGADAHFGRGTGLIDSVCGIANPSGLGLARETFAGRSVIINYEFHREKLWEIEIYGLSPEIYESVLDAMQSKYGKPVVNRTKIQNRMGAIFDNAVATWRNGDVIVYSKYTNKLDEPSSLEFFSEEAWLEITSALHQKQQSARNDM